MLTDRTLRSLKPPAEGRITLSDGTVPGLQFRLTSGGVGTWSLMINTTGKKRRFTIGPYPGVGLAEARKRATELRVKALDGYDPVAERRHAEAAARSAIYVSETIDLYASSHLHRNLRSGAERERHLRTNLARYLKLPVSDLERRHFQLAIQEKARSAPVMANRLRASFMHYARWLFEHGYTDTHVGLGLSKVTKESPRERVLDLGEVRKIWEASHEEDLLWGPFLRLLLLTAQRRGDVAGMRWSELDLPARRWLIPGRRSKNNRPHIVHLTAASLAELDALSEHRNPEWDLVFTTNGANPISGFSKVKSRLDTLSGVEDWRLHDIRTAFASALCDAGEPENVVDRVLNHVASGSAPSAVARVYNRADLLPQRAAVLERWADMVTTDRGKVVRLNWSDAENRMTK